MQAEMFNHMCSVRSSEMNISELECKDSIDAQSEEELFNNQLWKDPGLSSSKRDYDINIFHNSYDTSDNLLLNDSNL